MIILQKDTLECIESLKRLEKDIIGLIVSREIGTEHVQFMSLGKT